MIDKNRRLLKPDRSDLFSGFKTRMTLSFLIGLLYFTPLFSGSHSGADFLKIPVGARPTSLGQAYTALANDADALNWNVAGLSRMKGEMNQSVGGFSLSHLSVLEENSLDNVALALPLPRVGNHTHIGFSLTRFSIQGQTARNTQREVTGTFGASDLSVGVAMASRFRHINLGGQVKLIRQELAGEVAQGAAVDIGMISETVLPRLSIGASVRNWGSSMKFISEKYSLPLTLSLGLVFEPIRSTALVFDIHSRPYQDQVFLAVGTEFNPLGSLTMRAGYLMKMADAVTNSQKDETVRGCFSGVSGLTGGLRFSIQKFNVDYAFMPFGELGNIQTITISSYFGGGIGKNEDFGQGIETSDIVVPKTSQDSQKSGESEKQTILEIPFDDDILVPSEKR